MKGRRGILVLAALTAFLDLVGFSIIFPLFPQLLEHYLSLEGPDSTIGRLVTVLRRFAGDRTGADFLVVVLFGGALGSIYSLLQFVFAPIWGAVSDRFGRRPTLLLTLAGTVAGYVAWIFAGTFGTLVAARLLGGMMAGNLSTVTAVVADVTDAKDRSKGMGIIGAAIGLGFIFGPAIGGLATIWGPLASFGAVAAAQAHGAPPAFALNPFSGAAMAACLLSSINLGLAIMSFPETLPPEKRGARTTARTANPAKLFKGLRLPGVQRVNVLSFFYLSAFAAMEFTLTFLAVERFGYTPRQNAELFVFVGLIIAVVQGGVLRRLAPRLGDRRVALTGLVLLVPGFVMVGLAPSAAVLYGGLAFMATGSALTTPCLSALMSQYAPPDQQGLALGLFRSMGALSRAVGPLAGGLLYWRFGSTAPYFAGAVALLLPMGLAIGLPEPQPDPILASPDADPMSQVVRRQ